jgi:hypothetical protein
MNLNDRATQLVEAMIARADERRRVAPISNNLSRPRSGTLADRLEECPVRDA